MKKSVFIEFIKILFLSLITGLFIFATTGKKPPAKALEKLIDRYYSFHKQFPQQKIYIQTDKPYYISGDEMFGKVYLVNETRWGIDSVRSKKIYVELINNESKVVEKTIVNGLFSSLNFSFHLPDSIRQGNYILRAYTSWMISLNNAQNIFRSYIYIFNKKNAGISASTFRGNEIPANDSLGESVQPDNAIDVSFLPEGGDLVNGIENNVAFKAIDSRGYGIDVDGYIKNNKGDTVCIFKSTHLGLGEFEFIPGSRYSYTAYVTLKNGKQFIFPFSSTNNYAYQLSVIKRSEDSLTLRVALGDSLYKKNVISYVVATSHGGVYFTSRGTGIYEENISLKTFPEGIAQLTLFDSAMQVVSERLIYIHHPNAKVIIHSNKNNYRRREKVTLTLKTVDSTGKLLKGIYSVSVTDDHVVKHDENEGNIKTHLLLSPYLKGYIEELGYYFKNDDSTTLKNLDLVMLTHGWSRFTWNDIEKNNLPQPQTIDSSLSITGKITMLKNTPAANYSVTLLAPADNVYIGTVLTNESGEFRFTGIDFADTTKFVVQIKDSKGRNEDVNVSFDPIHFPLTFIERPLVPDHNYSDMANGIAFYKRFMYDSMEDNRKAKLLKEVIISKKIKKLNYDESKRVSTASYVITPDIIEKYGNGNVSLTDFLYMVPGFTGSSGQISFFGLNGYASYPPLVVVDGVEIPSVNLNDIAPRTVSYIEVLRGGEAAIYGMRGAAGAVVVHTKTGSQINATYFKQKGIKNFEAEGYQVEKQFYSPKYETDESLESKIPDERTTIYWNGYVNTNSKAPTTISFYTADMPTTYTLTIDGIAENGDLIHERIPIERTR